MDVSFALLPYTDIVVPVEVLLLILLLFLLLLLLSLLLLLYPIRYAVVSVPVVALIFVIAVIDMYC